MNDKRTYKVAVTETLRRVVRVEAKDEAEAHQRTSDAWHNGEITLVAEDFDGVEFYVQGEADGAESDKYLPEIDGKNTVIPNADEEVGADA